MILGTLLGIFDFNFTFVSLGDGFYSKGKGYRYIKLPYITIVQKLNGGRICKVLCPLLCELPGFPASNKCVPYDCGYMDHPSNGNERTRRKRVVVSNYLLAYLCLCL